MKSKYLQIRILALSSLLMLLGILFFSFSDENILQPCNPMSTATPQPIDDVFLVRCESIVEISQGDTLSVVAMNYSISEKEIMQYNRLKTKELFPGMKLLIPLCRNMPTPTTTPVE